SRGRPPAPPLAGTVPGPPRTVKQVRAGAPRAPRPASALGAGRAGRARRAGARRGRCARAVAIAVAAVATGAAAEAAVGRRNLEALVELDCHERAVRLLHVRLVRGAVRVGLDPDHGRAGHGG